ncbi:putative phage virion morphogenesis protein [Hoylesella oralis ATCC 33269]|uniref:Phage virion morphogenesis protein n=1 Tax=Hoylesella oralis ATCC 33269 TaxID=873533 RepID=E7RRU2_9BACT|nr:phage virion morphogenesis protein [Hoylesella oralis]EFZ36980.1 putative phage virion morphogenesis protein [Hoylesella oralis ATCC 33269]EPH18676.1 hypothetical protein HMPREF1475_00584 [Hoylesella oralis HGA0225]SHF78195.1 Phage virion morphogenesis family protein [Hoylesella oralis]
MDMTGFIRLLQSKKKETDDLIHRKFPVKAGRMAKDHFQENFLRQGFVNGGLYPWKKTRRQLSGGGAEAGYGALLSARDRLFGSISYAPGDARVTVYSQLRYAPLHNWGGCVSPQVTPQMRRFAWAMYYKSGGRKGRQTPEADRWKALALTKKQRLNIHIPQRQFLGGSRELTKKIREKMEKEIRAVILK